MGGGVNRVVSSLFVTILCSVIMCAINWLLFQMLEAVRPGGIPLFPKRSQSLNPYEQQIAQNIVEPATITERLDQVGGLSDIKEEIRTQVLLPLKHPKVFFGEIAALHPPKGLLLHGPPGTGKTMLAKSIAAEAQVPFLSLSLSTLENKFFGESSKLLRATFSLAKKIQPCIVFFDEIDGMIRTRTEGDQSCVYGFKTEFLTHMDGMHTQSRDAIIVIGCTNCATNLDPAIRRRLPKQIKVGLPTSDELIEIFALNLSDTSISRTEIRALVEAMRPGCSGSEVKEIVRAAWNAQMKMLARSPQVLSRLDEGIDAKELHRLVGHVRYNHLMHALLARGWIVESDKEGDSDSDDESAPPAVDTDAKDSHRE